MNTQDTMAQMVLDHADDIDHGVRSALAACYGQIILGEDVCQDLVADATLALLDSRGAAFDPARGTPKVFCRMVAYQVARDKVRSMNRGGQFSGAYSGFGNVQLNANNVGKEEKDDQGVRRTPAGNMHAERSGACDQPDPQGRCVRILGKRTDNLGGVTEIAETVAQADWTLEARAAIAPALAQLTTHERLLWDSLAADTFSAPEYARRYHCATATAYVHATRLRAKMRKLVREFAPSLKATQDLKATA
jgi:DNA-directed RNA polymerase specialized sigma24 family protein